MDWKRAADGIGLCVIAAFLLLNTSGALPWSFWLDAISLWPLLIMSAGIKIAFEKTRAPWLVLLGPAVVLAGLVWVATGPGTELPPGAWKSEGPLPRPEGARRVKLELEVVGSRLSIEAREIEQGALADARSIERIDNARLEVDRQDDTARLRFSATRQRGVTFLPGRKQYWDFGVPQDLPLRVELRGAMSRTKFDLAQGRFEGATIDGAFLATQLTLPEVDEPVKLTQKGAFSVLRVSVPKGTPVTVKGTGFPFNLVKRSVKGEPGRAGYEITLDSVFSALAIETRSASKPEAAPSPAAPSERPKPEAEPVKPASPAAPVSPAPVRG